MPDGENEFQNIYRDILPPQFEEREHINFINDRPRHHLIPFLEHRGMNELFPMPREIPDINTIFPRGNHETEYILHDRFVDRRDRRTEFLAGMMLHTLGVDTYLRQESPTAENLSDPQWLVERAEFLPVGWNKKRLGSIIKNRLASGVDTNLHDATYWLVEFDCPERVADRQMYSPADEKGLILALVCGENPEKLPANAKRIDKLFHDEELANLYKSLREMLSAPIADGSRLDPGALIPERFTELRKTVADCQEYNLTFSSQKQSEILEKLRQMSKRREAFTNDAQRWLQTHSDTPRDLLVFAWKNRDLALKEGVDDNPNAIKNWADNNTVLVMLNSMMDEGVSPSNLTHEDLETYKGYLSELSRCYDPRTVINALATHKEIFNPEAFISSRKSTLSGGFQAEILEKDDPRGYTIGHDSGCCMTVTGLGRKCLDAGYGDPRYSFFALYDKGGKLVAQSLLYTDPEEAPNTLVIDNIEVTGERDRNKVLGLYTEFFTDYLALQPESVSHFDQVNLGVHVTEHYDQRLKETSKISTPLFGTYSDAHRQKVMVEQPLSSEKVLFIPANPRDKLIIDEIEQKVYGEGDPTHEGQDFNATSNPDNYSYLLTTPDTEEEIGYLIAYKDNLGIFGGDLPNEEVLYIDDLAILPEYQDSGIGREVFMSILGKSDKLKLPILFHAKDKTSWSMLSSHQDEIKRLGYSMTVLEEDKDYYAEDDGAHLVIFRKS